jgi:hypothetical protein
MEIGTAEKFLAPKQKSSQNKIWVRQRLPWRSKVDLESRFTKCVPNIVV